MINFGILYIDTGTAAHKEVVDRAFCTAGIIDVPPAALYPFIALGKNVLVFGVKEAGKQSSGIVKIIVRGRNRTVSSGKDYTVKIPGITDQRHNVSIAFFKGFHNGFKFGNSSRNFEICFLEPVGSDKYTERIFLRNAGNCRKLTVIGRMVKGYFGNNGFKMRTVFIYKLGKVGCKIIARNKTVKSVRRADVVYNTVYLVAAGDCKVNLSIKVGVCEKLYFKVDFITGIFLELLFDCLFNRSVVSARNLRACAVDNDFSTAAFLTFFAASGNAGTDTGCRRYHRKYTF